MAVPSSRTMLPGLQIPGQGPVAGTLDPNAPPPTLGGRIEGTFGAPADDWFGQQGYDQWAATQGGPGGAAPPGGPTGSAGMQAALETSPGYQFRLNEGLQALQRSAAARGTLLTGGTLKGLERYAQNYASGEYQNRYNQLMGLAQLGQASAAGQAASNQQYANAGSDLLTQGGNAAAAGTIGGANAWQQPFAQGANLAQMYYLSRLFQPTSSPGPMYGPGY